MSKYLDKPDDQYLDGVQLNFDEEFGSNLKSSKKVIL